MKLILDEHISPRVADALRATGHDVAAVAESVGLRAADDETVLAAATAAARAVVTHNFADFLAIAAEWARTDRTHSGTVLVPVTFQRQGLRAYVSALGEMLEAPPISTGTRGCSGSDSGRHAAEAPDATGGISISGPTH